MKDSDILRMIYDLNDWLKTTGRSHRWRYRQLSKYISAQEGCDKRYIPRSAISDELIEEELNGRPFVDNYSNMLKPRQPPGK